MHTLLFILISGIFQPADTGLNVVFTHIKEDRGQIYVAVYDRAESYMSPEKARAVRIVPVRQKGSLTCAFPELGPGTYAVSCFHDVNGNGTMDTNFLGIPSEPYGASNNARPKFRAPNWQETRFEWKKEAATISLILEKW